MSSYGVGALEQNMIQRVCVGDIVTRSADLFPDRPAFIADDRQVTYRELQDQSNRLGNALLGLGLQSGDVVGVLARNIPELIVVYFACAKAGLVCAPGNLALRAEEIGYCFKDARARVLIVEDALGDLFRALPELPDLKHVYWTPEVAGEPGDKFGGTLRELIDSGDTQELEVIVQDRDPVQLLYTSGTTALPKGVVTSHLAVTLAALTNALANEFKAGTTVLGNLPLFHTTAINCITISALTVGGTIVLINGFEPKLVGRLIEEHRINMFVLLPIMYSQLLAEPEVRQRDLSSVRRALYAMAPMPHERLKDIHDLFPNADVVLGSGQTEFTPATCIQRPEHQWDKAASWGPATALTRIAIMADDGRLLPHGQEGEIVYRGPQVMNGYLNQPEKTQESFRHGWFHSGDVAWLDEEGVVWFTDRKKDVIKSGGENVASIEVERCLMEHPDVMEAAVVGLPHDRWGEAVTGIVVLKPGAQENEEALLQHCRNHLAGFKVPKAIRFQLELPRTGTGKIQKHVMRDELAAFYERRRD